MAKESKKVPSKENKSGTAKKPASGRGCRARKKS